MSSRFLRYWWAPLALAVGTAPVWPVRAADPPSPESAPSEAAAPAADGAPGTVAPVVDGSPHGRVSGLSGKLMLRGKDDDDYSYVEKNTVVRDGDSLWTDETATAEIEMEKDSFVRLGPDTKLEVRHLPPDSDLRLWKGSIYVDLSKRLDQGLLVKTPAGDVDVDPDTVARIDIGKKDSTKLTVYEGRATAFPSKGDRVRVAKGRRLFLDPGEEADFPRAIPGDEEQDALDRFQVGREGYYAARPVPKELPEPQVGARELDDAGKWVVVENTTYWQPTVTADWQPFLNGDWVYMGGQWCWNPIEPWGYLTCHFGRWCYLPAAGWAWYPGTAWSPAWVCWANCGDYISWCPLDRFNQPCVFSRDVFKRGRFRFDPWCWCSIHRRDWDDRHGAHHSDRDGDHDRGHGHGDIRRLRDRDDAHPRDLVLGPHNGWQPVVPKPRVALRGNPATANGVPAGQKVKALESWSRPPAFRENSLADRVRAERLHGAATAGAVTGSPRRHVDPFAIEDARERLQRSQSFTADGPGAARGQRPGSAFDVNRRHVDHGTIAEQPNRGGASNSGSPRSTVDPWSGNRPPVENARRPGESHRRAPDGEPGLGRDLGTGPGPTTGRNRGSLPRQDPYNQNPGMSNQPGRYRYGGDSGVLLPNGGTGTLPGNIGRIPGRGTSDRTIDPGAGRWGPGGDPTGGLRPEGFGSNPGLPPGTSGRVIDPRTGVGSGFGGPGGFGRGTDPGAGGYGRTIDPSAGAGRGVITGPGGYGAPGGYGGTVGGGTPSGGVTGGGRLPGQPGWGGR